MRTKHGVTEEFWSSASAEFKLAWSVITKAAGVYLSFSVPKTGYPYPDLIIGIFTGVIPLLVIAFQRDFSKYKLKSRRFISRFCVGLIANSVTGLSLGLFFAIFLPLYYKLFSDLFKDVSNILMDKSTPVIQVLPTVFQYSFIIVCFLYVNFSFYRKLNIELLIFHMPRRIILNFIARRNFIARDFSSFAHFEFGVLAASLIYSALFSAGVDIVAGHIDQSGTPSSKRAIPSILERHK